jgi:hypothetical protein
MKGFFNAAVVSVVGVFLLLAGLFYYKTLLPSTHQTPVACTQEAKQCPDGSYVGRTGPNCAFAVCPSSTSSQGSGTIVGTMVIGPLCPVEQVGHPCKPTAAMYAAHPVFVYSADKTTLVKTLTPDANGDFSAALSPGTYYVDVKHQSIGAIRGAPVTLSIISGESTALTISIDTGIR